MKKEGDFKLPALTEKRLQLLREFNVIDKFGRKKPEKNSEVYSRIFLYTFENIPQSVLPFIARLDEADGHEDLEERVNEARAQLDKYGVVRTKPIFKQTNLSKAQADLIDGEARSQFFAKLHKG